MRIALEIRAIANLLTEHKEDLTLDKFKIPFEIKKPPKPLSLEDRKRMLEWNKAVWKMRISMSQKAMAKEKRIKSKQADKKNKPPSKGS